MKQKFYDSQYGDQALRLSYLTWGNPENFPVVCVHGLVRNAHDFDFLADVLAENYYVICPDVVGRGKSSWLEDKSGYELSTYVFHLLALLQEENIEKFHMIGTSMGGIIGMILAGQEDTAIAKLVINDIGSRVPKEALQRIAHYVGQRTSFEGSVDYIAYLKEIMAGFGELPPRCWEHLATYGLRPQENHFVPTYDPGIFDNFSQSAAEDIDLSEHWQHVAVPTLLLRGGDSDILPQGVYDMMTAQKNVTGRVFGGCGHAPPLMTPDQIQPVYDWLRQEC